MDTQEQGIQKRETKTGLYLYFLQAMGLLTTAYILVQLSLNTEQGNVIKLYQALLNLLYIPALILVFYAFKHVVKISNRSLFINMITFLSFGAALALVSKLGRMDAGLLFFSIAPIVLYGYSRFVLKIYEGGWGGLLKFIMHLGVFTGSLFVSSVLIMYATIYGGRHTYIKDFYVGDIYIENAAEVYIENPPLIFLIVMILFISRQTVNRPVKEKVLMSVLAGILYGVCFYGFWGYIDSV